MNELLIALLAGGFGYLLGIVTMLGLLFWFSWSWTKRNEDQG